MSRHRSPQGRRAHHGPPLSALAAAAGAGSAHRSVPLPHVVSTPVRAIATLIAGGALAAAGQQALTSALPAVSEGTTALRVSLDNAVGLTPPGSSTAAVAPVPPEPGVADASSLIKAAELQKAAAAQAARPAAATGAAIVASAPDGAAAAAAPGGAVQILNGRVTSGFGQRWGTGHMGLDIAAPIGTPINVPLAGTVVSSGPASGFGMWVRVQHATARSPSTATSTVRW